MSFRSAVFVFVSRLVRAGVAGGCGWVQAWQWGILLVAQLGMRERFARDHFVAHGGVVDENGLDGGDLLQVSGNEMFVRVHVGVVRAGLVVGVVLNELEARDADG